MKCRILLVAVSVARISATTTWTSWWQKRKKKPIRFLAECNGTHSARAVLQLSTMEVEQFSAGERCLEPPGWASSPSQLSQGLYGDYSRYLVHKQRHPAWKWGPRPAPMRKVIPKNFHTTLVSLKCPCQDAAMKMILELVPEMTPVFDIMLTFSWLIYIISDP